MVIIFYPVWENIQKLTVIVISGGLEGWMVRYHHSFYLSCLADFGDFVIYHIMMICSMDQRCPLVVAYSYIEIPYGNT